MINPFASPEEAQPYEFQEFPKAPEEVTEYANLEGAVDYALKDFVSAQPVDLSSESAAPVVQPAVFQDFKEVIPAPQT